MIDSGRNMGMAFFRSRKIATDPSLLAHEPSASGEEPNTFSIEAVESAAESSVAPH